LGRRGLLPAGFSWAAFALAALFEVAGIAAIFGSAGLIFAIVMSIVQEFWIIGAAIALWIGCRPPTPH
jgi:hypothetical protein